MKPSFLEWLDRYIEVDRLNIRPEQMFPRMRWWEWIWYVAVVIATALAFDRADTWLRTELSTIPVLNWAPWVITWPVLGVLTIPITRYLLPAHEARKQTPGENWLVVGLWLSVSAVQYLLGK